MTLLERLATEYKTLSIVGMAKNAGKTTALNFLIEEAMDEGLRLGITSTGRDGEDKDLVTGTQKPQIFLDTDTLVTVPTGLYDMADAGLEILERTGFSTPLGDVLICRVADSGYVQVAGPVATADTRRLTQRFLDMGCDMVLVDGAIDRKSIASPEASDAIILSTGAVLSRSMKRVAAETAYIVELYGLPTPDEPEAGSGAAGSGAAGSGAAGEGAAGEGAAGNSISARISEAIGLNDDGHSVEDERITLFKGDDLRPTSLSLLTGLGAGREIADAIDEETRYVYVPGAFTPSVISHMNARMMKNVKFVLKDPTRIFFDSITWAQLRKKGLKVCVMRNIKVAAITVNPWSPEGYIMDSDGLIDQLSQVIKDIPVVDVRK